MKIILFGIPGAGKSTQGNLLSKQLRLPYLSTGHIFRRIAQEKTKWGRFVKETLASGLLIPNKETIQIVEEYLARSEYNNGYILDGFPRNLSQVRQFKNDVDHVIYLNIPDKETLWRISGRKDEARDDQTLAAMRKRIEIFHKTTTPAINHYKKLKKLIEVNGTRSIRQVNEYILKSIGKTIGKNGLKKWSKRKKIALAIVGLPGAGKTAASDFFKKKGFVVVRLGDITDDIIKKKGLPFNKENEKKIREGLRKKYGMDAYLKQNVKKIKHLLKTEQVVIIDGMRSYEEYVTAQKEFDNVFLLAIVANKELRYARIKKRKTRANLRGSDRDLQEVLNLNIGPTIALADAIIINNGSKVDFENELENIYRKVYYGIS